MDEKEVEVVLCGVVMVLCGVVMVTNWSDEWELNKINTAIPWTPDPITSSTVVLVFPIRPSTSLSTQ